MQDSCVGDSACKDAGSNVVVDAGDAHYIPLFVGRNSCIPAAAEYICTYIEGNPEPFCEYVEVGANYPVCGSLGGAAKSAVVGAGSCIGGSCYQLSKNTNGTISVGSQSCEGPFSCIALAQSAVAAEIVIGCGSCTGELFACSTMALGSASLASIDISDGSCVGNFSCSTVGYSDSSSITVGKSSCLGYATCSAVGRSTTGDIMIGDQSCNQAQSCRRIGQYAASVAIGDGSCAGAIDECRYFGFFINGAVVSVGDGVCTENGTEACTVSMYGGNDDCDGNDGNRDINYLIDGCVTSFVMVEDGNCTGLCT